MNQKSICDLRILGSVSPYPTKNNNCPGYLLNIFGNKILLDCGPGVCKELNFPNDLNNLNIFISHFHYDHYVDLFSIGYASYVYHNLGLITKKINVYIPKLQNTDVDYISYISIKNMKEQYFNIIEYDENSRFAINDVSITFMRNYHPVKTFSTKIEFYNKVVVYSADLGFKSSNDLVKFSKNSDILLIESSFVKSDNAKNQYHLHAYEAAEIARDASVKKLILTHFWPAHNKKVYLKEAQKFFKQIILAKTGKKIKI